MNGTYSIVDLKQDSNEWIAWRHDGITATDAPIIMGENPYRNIDELLQIKISPPKKEYINARLRQGLLLEPEARKSYNIEYNQNVRPVCLQSNSLKWLKASLDGLSFDKNRVTEFKCGESAYKSVIKHNKVPIIYHGQLQHILAITGLSSIDFFCYLPGKPTGLIEVARDESYIKVLIEKEEWFWNLVQKHKAKNR